MMSPKRPFVCLRRSLLILAWSIVGISCSSSDSENVDNPLSSRAWWKGDGVAGKPRIVINLSTQRVQYYKGKELVGVSPISSGRESFGTITGSFRILDKDENHRSSLFGAFVDAKDGHMVQEDVDTRTDRAPPGTKYMGASMRYFMRIVGGIGMHEGYLPGYPASHGCIRMPTKMAAIFFKETPVGTPVEIVGESALAAMEEAIPIGVDKIEDAPAEEPKPQARKKTPEAVVVAETKTAQKPKTMVRRAIVEVSKPSGFGSWFKRTPRGSTMYWQP